MNTILFLFLFFLAYRAGVRSERKNWERKLKGCHRHDRVGSIFNVEDC